MKILFILLFSSLILFAKEPSKISLQLQWKHQFQFAGYYMAKEKGFYGDANLDVEIKEYKSGMNISNEIINHKSTFGVGRSSLLIERSKGKKIVLLNAFFQSSPNILLATKDSNIHSIDDFKNKRIMITGNAQKDATIMSMIIANGVTMDELQIQKHSFDINDLIEDKTDLMSSYISNEPFLMQERGKESVIFDPKDYGFDFYNDILFTSENALYNNYKNVKNFALASQKGWKYAFENIEETVDIIVKKYNSQNKSRQALLYEANELKKLAYYKTKKLGEIKKEKFQNIFNHYALMGFVKDKINFDDFVFSFTESKHYLNARERNYLKKKQIISMCIDPNGMPFEELDEQGKHSGITSDYYHFFEKTLKTKFEIVKTTSWNESVEFARQRKCDILSMSMATEDTSKYMNFTTPYLSVPLVIVTKPEISFINKLEDLNGAKVGVPKSFTLINKLKSIYPEINIVAIDNIDEGLDKVISNELFAYIGSLASIAHKFQTDYIGELKIAGKIDHNLKLSVAIRDDDTLLLSIMQKAVNEISQEQSKNIFNKWVSIKYENKIDYTLLFEFIAIFAFILITLTYFLIKQKKLKDKLTQAYEELEKLALTDKLTGLCNRHKLDQALEYEKNIANRYKHPFGIMILDIDFFKRVNDTFGHQVGDDVLQELAYILTTDSRETDVVGRWGGEEFLVIYSHADKKALLAYAEKLRLSIEQHQFRTVGNITVSVGVASYSLKESLEETVKRADDALYDSKNNGRNQVTYKSQV